MKIALLCGGYPPDFDAIGQYTRELGLELARQGEEVYILTSGTRKESDGPLEIRGVFDPKKPSTLLGLPDAISRERYFDWIVVQYNPFSFGPRGYAPQLIRALREIQDQRLANVAMMAHETHVSFQFLKPAIFWTWQFPQFYRLAKLVDRIFVSTDRWGDQIREVSGATVPISLPVGSNIPLCPLSRTEAREAIGLDPDAFVMGIFGNSHPDRLFDWAAEAARSVPGATLLYVGKDGAAVRKVARDLNLRDEGALSDSEVAVRLRAMDCLISPFSDGISSRRSSVIAGLRHGLPILATSCAWSDRLMLDHPLVISSPMADGRAAFAALGPKVRELCKTGVPTCDFETSPFAWPVIARKLSDSL